MNAQKSQQESDIFDGAMTHILGTAARVLYTLSLSLAYWVPESNNYCTVLFLAFTDTHQAPLPTDDLPSIRHLTIMSYRYRQRCS